MGDKKPYLDKLVTAPHIPKQIGQVGYCSLRTFPDLSCTGIRSAFEPKQDPATTPEGRITEEYKQSAHKTLRSIHREIAKENSKIAVFRIDHSQYIDRLLIDLEETKLDKHNRRMRHWKKTKDTLGFNDSFNTQYRGSGLVLEPLKSTIVNNTSSDPSNRIVINKGAIAAQNSIEADDASIERKVQAAMSKLNIPSNAPPYPSKLKKADSSNTQSKILKFSLASDNALGTSTQSGFITEAGSTGNASIGSKKNRRVHSRMALFTELLETSGDIASPVKRFGTSSLISTKSEESNGHI